MSFKGSFLPDDLQIFSLCWFSTISAMKLLVCPFGTSGPSGSLTWWTPWWLHPVYLVSDQQRINRPLLVRNSVACRLSALGLVWPKVHYFAGMKIQQIFLSPHSSQVMGFGVPAQMFPQQENFNLRLRSGSSQRRDTWRSFQLQPGSLGIGDNWKLSLTAFHWYLIKIRRKTWRKFN